MRPFIAENLCPSATVICVRDGALAEEYAVSSTTLVVDEATPLTSASHIGPICATEHQVLNVRQLSLLQRCMYTTTQIAKQKINPVRGLTVDSSQRTDRANFKVT